MEYIQCTWKQQKKTPLDEKKTMNLPCVDANDMPFNVLSSNAWHCFTVTSPRNGYEYFCRNTTMPPKSNGKSTNNRQKKKKIRAHL